MLNSFMQSVKYRFKKGYWVVKVTKYFINWAKLVAMKEKRLIKYYYYLREENHYLLNMVSPSMATPCSVKEEGHTLLCASWKEDRFVVPTRQAADLIRAR